MDDDELAPDTEPDPTDSTEGSEPSEGDETPDAPGIPFEALLIIEGVETSDDRYIQPGAITWRTPPLPFMSQLKSEHGGPGDTAASIGGRLDTIERYPLGTWDGNPQGDVSTGAEIIAQGMLDAEGQVGLETARLVAGQFLRGVSADMAVNSAEIEITAVDDDGYPIGERLIVTSAELGMATATPFPAFADCQLRLLDEPEVANDPLAVPEMPEVGDRIPILASIDDGGQRGESFTYTLAEGCVPCQDRGETLLASGGPLAPPAAWFTDPQLAEPTPHTITDEGRVFGTLAAYSTCHTGSSQVCITAPRESDYSYFETGALVTAEGETLPVGQLTLAGGHADLKLGYRAAMQHYDDTNSAIADVRMFHADHGIVYSGALRPGVTDEQVRAFRAAPLSGDWRPIGGALRLVAACSVNVPGFPLPRARVASGQTLALVAAGVVREEEDVDAVEPGTLAAALDPTVVTELHAWANERAAERALSAIDKAADL